MRGRTNASYYLQLRQSCSPTSALRVLKDALCSYPILRQPDFGKPFVLYTDASDYAIGAALCQEFDGKLCAIHFASRSLIKAERNYSVQEKEALAIVFAVKKFRKSILGSRFKIRCLTDHKSLECLTNANELAGRMARWAMIMSEYNYSVEYIKGATNTAADALSRLIAMPNDAWRPLTLEDHDSDENHPFLLLWPEVQLLCMASQYDPARTAPLDGTTCMIAEVPHTVIEREERLNHPLHDIFDHERVLFSRTTVFTGDIKVLNIHHGLYSNCSDFKNLYEYLLDTGSVNTGSSESAAPVLRSNRSYGDPGPSGTEKPATDPRKDTDTGTGPVKQGKPENDTGKSTSSKRKIWTLNLQVHLKINISAKRKRGITPVNQVL